MESSSPMQKRGSWSILAGMATEMVNSLEFGNDDYDIEPGPSTCQRRNSQQSSSSLPAMHNRGSSMPVPTKGGRSRRGSGTFMDLFSGDKDDYDPSTIDLKSQAKAKHQSKPGMFSSFIVPMPKNNQAKKDPLMDFHERHNKAQNEYKRQEEAKKRRQQLQDHDDDKSLASSNSLFDFLVRTGAADEIYDNNGASEGGSGGGMKRSGSTHSMASLFGLFGDDEDEIEKLSSNQKPVSKKEKEDPSLQAAVKQSKSVKGHRVFVKGEQAAEKGDWKKAVAYYHIALVKQREYYGEDHHVTSKTLNSLGVALMKLGEHFGALTALEEALHIRQESFGAGAEEVAETTSNIWMVLKSSQEEEEQT